MNTLLDPQVAKTLDELHRKATIDSQSRITARQTAAEKGELFDHAWATAYMAVSPEEGAFLYFLATVAKAKKIVEFGCSFGISTIYLAAAARDTGGWVTTTDIEPNKVTGTQKNVDEAGLADRVEILLGDATQTLATLESPIDFLFLDGAKELYLPVFNLLRPKLGKGAIVFADNADKSETRPFVEAIRNAKAEFTTVQLFDNRALLAYLR